MISERLRRFHARLAAVVASPLLPVLSDPALLSPRNCPDLLVHRAVWRGHFARSRYPWLAGVELALALLVWPIKLARQAHRLLRRSGAEAWCPERSLPLQAWDLLRAGLGSGIAPSEYYAYGLHRPQAMQARFAYIYDGEAKQLAPLMNADPRARIVNDKFELERHLADRGLRVASTLAWTLKGRLHDPEGVLAALPAGELFIKPVQGQSGVGTLLLRRSEAGVLLTPGPGAHVPKLPGERRLGADVHAPASQAWALIVNTATALPLLIQRRLLNHPQLADLSAQALMNARVLTGLRDGRAELLRAVWRLPLDADQIVIQGGLVAPIDETSGVLGAAVTVGPEPQRHVVHPRSGVSIAGRGLPCWGELCVLALRAHEALPGYRLLAWDIALTPEGPVILEANVGFGTETLQKPHDQPLMATRFAAYVTPEDLRGAPRVC